jgi:hypothetical protein
MAATVRDADELKMFASSWDNEGAWPVSLVRRRGAGVVPGLAPSDPVIPKDYRVAEPVRIAEALKLAEWRRIAKRRPAIRRDSDNPGQQIPDSDRNSVSLL